MDTTEGLDSFFYPGGKTGILLIHGFTGTAYIFQDLGQKLRSEGYTVYAPLIAGHGTSPDDLELSDRHEWYASVAAAYDQLLTRCDQVILIGASFGANLCCMLAAAKPEHITGIVLIGIPRTIYRQHLAKAFLPIFDILGIRYYVKPKGGKIGSVNSIIGGTNHSYDRIPIRSIKEFFACVAETDAQLLQKISAPVLLVQSTNDGLVKPESAKLVHHQLGSLKKQLHWVDAPHHELHLSSSAGQIMRLINRFIANIS